MKTSDFDFPLPESLIAKRPLKKRDSSRLMVLGRRGGIEHARFHELPRYLEAGDMLLLNKTKVLPVKLMGRKASGRELEIVLVKNISGTRWEILSRGGYTGALDISGRLRARITDGREAELEYSGRLDDILWKEGLMPLPPYIKREAEDMDKERYQTVYALVPGSIAAPTAGLHFTEELLEALKAKGVLVRRLTLHVGRGTFTPVRAEEVESHRMEGELFEMEKSLLDEISGLKGRLIAVGTTATRAMEGLLSGRCIITENGQGPVIRGSTDIFIYPGHEFRAVQGLITNFHLPRSTPLMLASALAGRQRLLDAYAVAAREGYRFFSYGDAMLLT